MTHTAVGDTFDAACRCTFWDTLRHPEPSICTRTSHPSLFAPPRSRSRVRYAFWCAGDALPRMSCDFAGPLLFPIPRARPTGHGKVPLMAATRTSPAWERYAWVAGFLFVLAVVAETAVSLGVPINQNDSAAKIARALADHRTTLLIVECLCVVYAATFPIYLWKLYYLLLRRDADGGGALGSL